MVKREDGGSDMKLSALKRRTKIILLLILAFVLDFLCYKFFGIGIINGNLLTIDVDIIISIEERLL